MDVSIRQARISDLPYIYDICLKTGKNGEDSSGLLSDKYIVGQYFAAPYLHFEIDLCFVIEKNSIPAGYIIGASSTEGFNTWMNTHWLPAIREFYPAGMNPKSDFEKFLIDTINKDCCTPDFLLDYPSHLHIDLLPGVQKMGYGKKLMSTFIEKLRSKRSTGVHLAAGIENTNAIEFYKSIGFKELKKDPGSLFMGIQFDSI